MKEHSLLITDRKEKILAEFGIVKHSILNKVGINTDVYYADINWNLLMKKVKDNTISFREISKFPSVSRDLALLVDNSVEFSQIEDIAYKTERKLLKKVELFDVYEGNNLESGKKSYAVNFILQDENKTLSDKQIEKVMQTLIAQLKNELNAQLR